MFNANVKTSHFEYIGKVLPLILAKRIYKYICFKPQHLIKMINIEHNKY